MTPEMLTEFVERMPSNMGDSECVIPMRAWTQSVYGIPWQDEPEPVVTRQQRRAAERARAKGHERENEQRGWVQLPGCTGAYMQPYDEHTSNVARNR